MNHSERVRFGHELWNGRDTLICPCCNCEYLHQEKIEVFERREDEATGVHTITRDDSVTVNRDTLLGNPSSRRQGLTIVFYCEGCGERYVMEIFQHKGNTFVGWAV